MTATRMTPGLALLAVVAALGAGAVFGLLRQEARSVTPATIQAKTRAIEDIKAAIDDLPESRDLLAEAVDRLDALEPAFTGYDLLRFGGPSSRQVWIEDVRAEHLAGEHPAAS